METRTNPALPKPKPGEPMPQVDRTLTQDAQARETAAALSQPREQPPAAIAGYTILRRIGEGAYGSVWLAREQNTGKQVAIKFYTHRRGLDWSLLNREVEKLAVLYTSRNIIGLESVGWDSDPPYYIMEYLKNGSLANFLAKGPLPPDEAIRIARSVLHALVHAHGSGILHCDLKPANILLDDEFEPRLCDFGQSRLSNEQHPALGTLFYMAPEQASLTAIPDARWDVYALGALFHHMLTGEPPHRTPENEAKIRAANTLEDRLAVYRQILAARPRPIQSRRPSGVDRHLAEIVDRCLRVDPQKRFPNAQAVLDALDQRERQRSRRTLVGLGIVGPVVLLIAIATVFWKTVQDTVNAARENVIQRASDSNKLSAELLAHSLRREVEDRLDELKRIAANPDLRNAILAARQSDWSADRNALWELLATLKADVDRNRKELDRRSDTSWFLNDALGFQRWREPADAGILDKNYAWRDYFHGRDVELPENGQYDGIQPIRKPHVSLGFRSTSTHQYMTALSVPIWDAEHQNVIAILARTAHLTELLDDYGSVIRPRDKDDVNRIIALVDRREWKLLDHPWMAEANLKQQSAEQLTKLIMPFPVVERLGAQTATAVEEHYRDPVHQFDQKNYGGEWIAALAPVEGTDWTAVVQERRSDSLKPVDRVQASLVKNGLLALGVSLALIPLVWYLVMRGLSDRHVRLIGVGANGGPPTATGSSFRSGSDGSD